MKGLGTQTMNKLLLFLLLLPACRHPAQDTKINDIQKLQEKLSFYCSQDIDPYKLVDRCDGLTFLGLYDAYCKRIDIYAHEYPAGQWHRSIKPCYPKDSRSEISFESQLGAIHACWARQDAACFKRMLKYAEAHDWILGEGPEEYTKLNELSFLIKRAITNLDKLAALTYDEAESKTLLDRLKGYRGKVITDYVSIKGKIYGYVNSAELALVKLALDKDPENPIYRVLYAKYEDGHGDDFNFAVTKLLDETVYPADKLPGHLGQIDWGDEMGQAVYAWMVSELE
jgi:hypothetical protein